MISTIRQMKVDRFNLLFFGSDSFSVRILKHLLAKQLCPVEVVTKAHSILDKYSAQRQLKRHFWPADLQSSHPGIDSFNIGLVASFGSLIDEATVERFRYGLFNVHPSLLPKYRGSTPVQTAIYDNVKETGCTIMRIPPVAKFDVGDIILQERIAIREGEYALELLDRLADLGALMAEQFLLNYEISSRQAKPQDSAEKSFARKLKHEQGHLKFKTDCLDLIDRKVRAYSGFIELYITCLRGLRVRLEGMVEPSVVEQYKLDQLALELLYAQSDRGGVILNDRGSIDNVPAGMMYFHKIRRQLCIKSADNKWTAFEWATPESKARMSALDFYNGYLAKRSQRLRITDM